MALSTVCVECDVPDFFAAIDRVATQLERARLGVAFRLRWRPSLRAVNLLRPRSRADMLSFADLIVPKKAGADTSRSLLTILPV